MAIRETLRISRDIYKIYSWIKLESIEKQKYHQLDKK